MNFKICNIKHKFSSYVSSKYIEFCVDIASKFLVTLTFDMDEKIFCCTTLITDSLYNNYMYL